MGLRHILRYGITLFSQFIAKLIILRQLTQDIVQLHVETVRLDFRLAQLLLHGLQPKPLLLRFAFAFLQLLHEHGARSPFQFELLASAFLLQLEIVELFPLLDGLFLILLQVHFDRLQNRAILPQLTLLNLELILRAAQLLAQRLALLIQLAFPNLQIGQ
ncbi:hypothetical protein D3C81_952570 [compost metagenome]